jgi:hypothetical protein
MTGIYRKSIQAWSFFMFGDCLDNAFAYKYLASNAGFITMSAYIATQLVIGVFNHEPNAKTNTKHNNIT